MTHIGFIGSGNMGSAMIQGISNTTNDCMVYVYDIDINKLNHLNQSPNIQIVSSIKEICIQSKYIVLSVKPKYYNDIFKEIKEYINNEHIIVTIAPGYSIERTKEVLGNEVRVVRAMPNTPALVGEGMTAYCCVENEMTDIEQSEIIKLFSSFGKCIKVKEEDMEAVTATSGSSPAYAYLFIEAMADAAVSFGLERETAYLLAAQSIKGAAQMVLDTKKHPGELKDAVCSPGGTTIQAVMKLEEGQLRNSVIQAMVACYEKAKDMN